MGICINYAIRKKPGKPNTAKICKNYLEFQYAITDAGYSKMKIHKYPEYEQEAVGRMFYPSKEGLKWFLKNVRRQKGFILVPGGEVYGEDENFIVDFEKTAGPATERGRFAKEHIDLCAYLKQLDEKGMLEAVYDEAGYYGINNLRNLREEYKAFMDTCEKLFGALDIEKRS